MRLSGRPWAMLVGSALLVALAFVAATWFAAHEQRERFEDELRRSLLTQARILAEALRQDWPDLSSARSAAIIAQTEPSRALQVAVLTADGQMLLGPEEIDPAALLQSSEAQRALLAGWGVDTRLRDGRRTLMAAVRAGADRETLGVVWLSRPADSEKDQLAPSRGLLFVAITIMAATLFFGLAFLRVRRRVLQRIVRDARRMQASGPPPDASIDEGDELGALTSSLADIRAAFSAQMATIERQRSMLESLVNTLHDGVVVTQPDGRIAMVNPAAMRLLDLATDHPGGVAGKPVENCVGLHSAQSLLLDPLGDDPATRERHERIEVETADGVTFLHAWVTELPALRPGEKAGRVLVLTDITDLQRAIQIRTDFVANASHELRTPLAAIRAAVETLQSMDLSRENDAALRFVDVIGRHSGRLEALVSDLLDLTRLESPGRRFEPQKVPLRPFLHELRARFQAAADQANLRLELMIDEAAPATWLVNPQLLQLALDNLLDNAIKYTPAGGKVTIGLPPSETGLSLRISDTGIGIPREEQDRVFERFYQVARDRSGARGTGLGLSIVRHAAAAMNAAVHLVSAPGEGTSVTIVIPAGDAL